MTQSPDLWRALLPVIEALESLAVRWHVGGSLASSFAGIARATQDADLVAELHPAHAPLFVAALTPQFYIAREAVDQAIAKRRSFNVIHLATMYKVDIFVPPDTPFARENRARVLVIDVPELGRTLEFASPEDMVLHKLLWYLDGGGVSDRQWYDLQGVLRVQGQALDLSYLREWARHLDIEPLLDKALAEAGIEGA